MTGAEPTMGYCINEVGACPRVPEGEFFDPVGGQAAIERFVQEHREWFVGTGKHVGIWRDKVNGVVVLDRVDVVEDLDAALAVGRERRQRSMWDVAAQQEIDLS